MVKHTQTIRQQFADKLFERVWPFEGLTLAGLNENMSKMCRISTQAKFFMFLVLPLFKLSLF